MARIIPYASLQFTAHEQYKMLLRTDSKKGWVDFLYFVYTIYLYIYLNLGYSGKEREGKERKDSVVEMAGATSFHKISTVALIFLHF